MRYLGSPQGVPVRAGRWMHGIPWLYDGLGSSRTCSLTGTVRGKWLTVCGSALVVVAHDEVRSVGFLISWGIVTSKRTDVTSYGLPSSTILGLSPEAVSVAIDTSSGVDLGLRVPCAESSLDERRVGISRIVPRSLQSMVPILGRTVPHFVPYRITSGYWDP